MLERKAPPTFETLVEIQERDRLAIHRDVAAAVDETLRGLIPRAELRERGESGAVTIIESPAPDISARSTAGARHHERRAKALAAADTNCASSHTRSAGIAWPRP